MRIFLPNARLNTLPRSDPVNPLHQVRERLHVFLAEPAALPALDPRPRLDVRHAVLALALAGEVVAGFFAVGVDARQADLEHAVDAQGLVLVAVDGVRDFFGRRAREVVDLALVGGTAAVCYPRS